MALGTGTQAQLARTAEERAVIARREAFGALLPQVDARLSRYSQSINLETFGFSLPGFPAVVGPFNVTDGLKITWRRFVGDLAAGLGAPPPRWSLPYPLAAGVAFTLERGYRLLRVSTGLSSAPSSPARRSTSWGATRTSAACCCAAGWGGSPASATSRGSPPPSSGCSRST